MSSDYEGMINLSKDNIGSIFPNYTQVESDADLPPIPPDCPLGVFSPNYTKWVNGRLKQLVIVNGQPTWSENLTLEKESWPRLDANGFYVWDVSGYSYLDTDTGRYCFEESKESEVEPGRAFISLLEVKEVPRHKKHSTGIL